MNNQPTKNYLYENCKCFFVLLILAIGSSVRGQITTAGGEKIGVSEMDQFIKASMDSLKIPGSSITIIHKGKIVYEKALGLSNIDTQREVNQQTIFETASMSKGVFAYFVMKLMQDGILKMDLDQPVYEYFPYPDIV